MSWCGRIGTRWYRFLGRTSPVSGRLTLNVDSGGQVLGYPGMARLLRMQWPIFETGLARRPGRSRAGRGRACGQSNRKLVLGRPECRGALPSEPRATRPWLSPPRWSARATRPVTPGRLSSRDETSTCRIPTARRTGSTPCSSLESRLGYPGRKPARGCSDRRSCWILRRGCCAPWLACGEENGD